MNERQIARAMEMQANRTNKTTAENENHRKNLVQNVRFHPLWYEIAARPSRNSIVLSVLNGDDEDEKIFAVGNEALFEYPAAGCVAGWHW